MNLSPFSARLRLATTAAGIALLASACGSDTADEAEAPADDAPAAEADEAAETETSVQLDSPGILAAACDGPDLVVNVVSPDDGSEVANARYTHDDLTGEEVPGFPAGRAVDDPAVYLPVCGGEDFGGSSHTGQVLIPEHDLLLVVVTEAGGTPTVGVMDPMGNVSALTDAGDGATSPRYDATEDRILYQEGGTIHEVSLASGDTAPAYNCGEGCENLWVDQPSGLISWSGPGTDVAALLSPDGSIVVNSENNTYWSVDSPTGVAVGATAGSSADEAEHLTPDNSLLQAEMGMDGRIVRYISDTEVVLDDFELSVLDVNAAELESMAGEQSSAYWAEIPTARTLNPDGPQNNQQPVLSPDGEELAFLSIANGGGAESWHRVPIDGSQAPTEIGAHPAELQGFVPIAWQ